MLGGGAWSKSDCGTSDAKISVVATSDEGPSESIGLDEVDDEIEVDEVDEDIEVDKVVVRDLDRCK